MITWLIRLPKCLPVVILVLTSGLVIAACGSSSATPSSASTSSAAPSSTAAGGSRSGTATGSATASASSATGPTVGFEAVPLEAGPPLGSAATTGTATVDGINCGPTEQLVYHIHAHLAVFVDGHEYQLPAGIGIPGSTAQETAQGPIAAGGRCIYWLHTHTTDGVIHVESPTHRIYTLGNFFDEWHQPLSADRVASVRGTITAFLNGKPWTRNIRAIPLIPHAVIQFDIGEPTPPLLSVDWSQTQL